MRIFNTLSSNCALTKALLVYLQPKVWIKAFIHTFGCKMNEYDSQRMAQLLDKGGY